MAVIPMAENGALNLLPIIYQLIEKNIEININVKLWEKAHDPNSGLSMALCAGAIHLIDEIIPYEYHKPLPFSKYSYTSINSFFKN